MTSLAMRDPRTDHLLTPQNSALVVIDYQPVQVTSILIMTALWTEACLTFPTLDALRDGYEVYPVIDAVGGTSVEAHRAALDRVRQAGAQPVGWVQLLCELQRDWARTETAAPFAKLVFSVEGH